MDYELLVLHQFYIEHIAKIDRLEEENRQLKATITQLQASISAYEREKNNRMYLEALQGQIS